MILQSPLERGPWGPGKAAAGSPQVPVARRQRPVKLGTHRTGHWLSPCWRLCLGSSGASQQICSVTL